MTIMDKKCRFTACVVGAFLSLGAPLHAETLTIALAASNSSLDPHFHNIGTNNATMRNIYDRLIHMDADMRLQPALAVSWTPVDDLTWDIVLRDGVTFHDGTSFGPEDVIFTVGRIPQVPNSPSAFTKFVGTIAGIEVIGANTLRITTNAPTPLLPNDLAQVSILSKATTEAYFAAHPGIAETAELVDSSHYNSGGLAIGTGPYKLAEWAPDSPLVLTVNVDYWGAAPAFSDVVFRPIQNDAARLAALQSGDVDLIDGLPTGDIARIQADSNFAVFEAASNLAVYLHLDSDRETSPFVTAKDGSAIANPLRDVNVRKAISMAINRAGIASAIMDGAAKPAGQMLDQGFAGASDNMPPMVYDAAGAKALLAEAGYPDGFALTLQTPNDRYVNDEKVALAIAQNLTQMGIATQVTAEPRATYFGNASKLEYSFMLLGWGSSTGEQGSSLESLMHTYNKDAGKGGSNRGRFSDPKFDEMIDTAMSTLDETERNGLVAAAAEYGIGEQFGIIPVHFQSNFWASRAGIKLAPRADNYTIASEVSGE